MNKMSTPSFQEWKKNNLGKGINEYYKEFPESKIATNSNQPIIIRKTTQKKRTGNLDFWFYIFLITLGFIGGYYAIQNYTKEKVAFYQKEIEAHSPQKYLALYNTKGEIALLGKSTIKGTIENKSNHTTYVNIKVNIEFYDKNENFVKQEEVILDKRMSPFDYHEFELKTSFPWKARRYMVRLVSADILRQDSN